MVTVDGVHACVVLQSSSLSVSLSFSLALSCSQALPIEETVVVRHAFGTGVGPTHISGSTLHDYSLGACTANGRIR